MNPFPFRKRPRVRPRRPAVLPCLELLEDRTLPSAVNVLVNSTTADTTAQDTQSETAIVLGSGSNIVAAFNDSESNVGGVNQFTGFAQSTNGGSSFTDKGSLPASTAGDAGDPSLARNTANGTVYLSTLAFSNSNVVQVFRSTTDGASFGAPVNGAPGFSSSHTLDKDWITVDNASGAGQGNVYLTFTDFGSFGSVDNGISLTSSTDGGTTWSSPVPVTGSNTQGSWVTTGPDHAVYVAYLDGSTTPERIRLAKSTNQGASFTTIGTIATLTTTGSDGDLGLTDASGQAVRTNAFAQVVVNPTNANILYSVYNDVGVKAGDKADIFFTESTNGGSTWSAPVKLNDDTTTNDQWQPGLAVTPDGTHVGVFWYDRRNDPADSLIERYGVIGTVSGSTVTFGANFRVSAPDAGSTITAFPAVVNQDPAINPSYMGDYDQVAADNTAFYTTWGDNRLSDAAHANQPDVRFAKVAILATSDRLQLSATDPSTGAALTSTPAGKAFNLTVTAEGANGNTDPTYAGTVHFSSTDGQSLLPANYTFTTTGTTADNGVHTFSVTLKTAGSQTVTVSDTTNASINGSTSVTVNPASAAALAFVQQPTTTVAGATMTPAVTVKILDAYGNLVSGDSTDAVSLAITSGTGTAGATLSGGGPVTASGGIAKFASLSINQAGTGYTLTATSGTVSGATATSASFSITSTKTIEDFESGNLSLYQVVGATTPTASVSTVAAHDGKYGLRDTTGNDWIYRNDAAAQVKEGDSISVWVQLNSAADGRAYFGFGASASGTLSAVLAPNTGQFLIQENSGYGFLNIGAANRPAAGYKANHWYRLEVDWSTTGGITGKLFDSDGKTLLDTVTATTPSGGPTSGGIAFRAIGHPKYWDTVTDTPGVNTTSPRSVAGAAVVSDPAADQADASGDRFAANLDSAGAGSVVLAAPAVAGLTAPPAQGAAASDLALVQISLVSTRSGPVLTTLPSVPTSAPAVPPTGAATLTVQAFLPPASHPGSGAQGGEETVALPEEELSLPAPPNHLLRPDVIDAPASGAPASRSEEAPPTGDFRLEESPLSIGDEYWMALAEQTLEPLPASGENACPPLGPAAVAAFALVLGSDRRTLRGDSRLCGRSRRFAL